MLLLGVGNSTFTPNSISNLNLWLKADTAVNTDGAASFGGTDQYLSTPTNSTIAMGGTDFALCGWVNSASVPGDHGIIGKWKSGNEEYLVESFGSHFVLNVANGATLADSISDTVTLSNNTWYFFYCDYTDSTKTIRVSTNNGAFQSKVIAFNVGASISPLDIGRYNTISYLNGSADSVGIWKRTLTPTEITFLYNSGSGRQYSDLSGAYLTNLSAWWDLAEESGTRYDRTSNHNDLTANGTGGVGPANGVANGPAQNNDLVRLWTDQSSNSYSMLQTTAAKKPLYKTGVVNGKPVVRFDGADDYMDVGTVLGKPANYTIFAVMQTVDVSVAAFPFASASSSGSAKDTWGSAEIKAVANGDTAYEFGDGTNYGFGATAGGVMANATWCCRVSKYTNGQAAETIRINGVDKSTSPSGTATSIGGTPYKWTLGRFGEYNNYYWGGDFAEVLIYTSALTGPQIAQVESYLSTKYALGF